MKIIIDNQIVRLIVSNTPTILQHPLLSNPDHHIRFRWPSLLEYLELGSIFSNLPTFDQAQPVFEACMVALCANQKKEVIFYLYERLFAEHLHQIHALSQINASFLLQAIQEQRQKTPFAENLVAYTLNNYERTLVENPTDAMHDLILYLAWDRMCVCMARIFDYQSKEPNFIENLALLKECLIESYQHITQQGRTKPGIARLLEAFLFYQMREENLQKHTDAEWTMLSQNFPVLKAQDALVDFFYIDDAIVPEVAVQTEEKSAWYLTLDSRANIHSRLSLARYMMDKLKMEVSGWGYTLCFKEIIYL